MSSFQNEGSVDRVVRVILGMAILTLAPGWFALLGLLPFLTGAIGYCPLYAAIGVKTCATPFLRNARS